MVKFTKVHKLQMLVNVKTTTNSDEFFEHLALRSNRLSNIKSDFEIRKKVDKVETSDTN